MMFVEESPILYATCVSAGESPRLYIIGTKIGAIIAHFAEADPMNRLRKADSKMNIIRSGSPFSPIDSKKSAPFFARIRPRFVWLKYFTNCAAKNARTRYPPMPFIAFVIASTRSCEFLIVPTVLP